MRNARSSELIAKKYIAAPAIIKMAANDAASSRKLLGENTFATQSAAAEIAQNANIEGSMHL